MRSKRGRTLKRRTLFHGTLLPALWPGLGLLPAAAYGTTAAPAMVFHDERFASAADLARGLNAACGLTPVRSDITPLWQAQIRAAARSDALLLAGVTTESFHFCLTRLLQTLGPVQAESRRVDQDLHAWTIAFQPYPQQRTA
jgi:hypothetical protein